MSGAAASAAAGRRSGRGAAGAHVKGACARAAPRGAALAVAMAATWAAVAACQAPQVRPALDLPPTPVLAMSTRWAVVHAEVLRLRSEPTLNGQVLSWLPEGTRVEVLMRAPEAVEVDGQTDYWYQVNHNGVRGWTFGAFITDVAVQAGTDDAAGADEGAGETGGAPAPASAPAAGADGS